MKKRDTLYILGIVGVVSLLAISSFVFKGGTTPDYKELEGREMTLELLRGGEMRETMPSEMFSGRAAMAYRYAKEIPEVFDSIYCYCGCEKLLGHKSLLSCHVTDHSLYCDICQRQALRAYELYKEGIDIISIRKTIDKEFAVSLGL